MMNPELELTGSSKTKTSDSPLNPTSPSLMSENITMPISNQSKPHVTPNRNLAWNVATNLQLSFKYAGAGVYYAFVTQRNFRIHVFMSVLAISLGAFLQVSRVELAIVGLTSALVLTFELLNTAIESVVDLTVKQSYHELAKTAKDCAAGAVLISAIAALLVAALILLPPLLALVF